MTPDDLLDAAQVREMLGGIPNGTLRSMLSRKQAPQGILLSPRRRVWRRSEITAWLAQRAIATPAELEKMHEQLKAAAAKRKAAKAALADELAAAREKLRETAVGRRAGSK